MLYDGLSERRLEMGIHILRQGQILYPSNDTATLVAGQTEIVNCAGAYLYVCVRMRTLAHAPDTLIY